MREGGIIPTATLQQKATLARGHNWWILEAFSSHSKFMVQDIWSLYQSLSLSIAVLLNFSCTLNAVPERPVFLLQLHTCRWRLGKERAPFCTCWAHNPYCDEKYTLIEAPLRNMNPYAMLRRSPARSSPTTKPVWIMLLTKCLNTGKGSFKHVFTQVTRLNAEEEKKVCYYQSICCMYA